MKTVIQYQNGDVLEYDITTIPLELIWDVHCPDVYSIKVLNGEQLVFALYNRHNQPQESE